MCLLQASHVRREAADGDAAAAGTASAGGELNGQASAAAIEGAPASDAGELADTAPETAQGAGDTTASVAEVEGARNDEQPVEEGGEGGEAAGGFEVASDWIAPQRRAMLEGMVSLLARGPPCPAGRPQRPCCAGAWPPHARTRMPTPCCRCVQ